MIGMILSSCTVVKNVDRPFNNDENEKKLNSGINNGNLEEVREAIEQGANINKVKISLLSEENPVILALNKNKVKIAKYLIEHGADANYSDKQGRSLLMFAADNTDESFCELLIKHGAKVENEDKKGYTALEYALNHSRKETTEDNIEHIITYLLEHGAKVRPVTLKAVLKGGYDDGESRYALIKRVLEELIKSGYKSELDFALESCILGKSSIVDQQIKDNAITKEINEQILYFTAAFGNSETMKLLLAKGLDLKSRDKLDNTLLIIAAQYGNLQMVKYLLDEGIEIDAINKNNESALYSAVKNNQYEIAEYLMKKGAKKIYQYAGGQKNILLEPSANGNIDMMKLIIANEYPLNDEYIGNAMIAAAECNKVETLKYSLDIGANINKEYNGYTALMMSSLYGNLEVVKFLVEHGAKIDSTNPDDSPLITAAKKGNTTVLEYLIKKGANVNGANIINDNSSLVLKSESPLMAAVYEGEFEATKLLVENGANLEYENETAEKDTAVIWAAGRGSKHILEYLIKKGAKINYQNEKGQTALMRAVIYSQTDNVKVLLDSKADVNLKDKDGHSALDLAKAAKHEDIVTLLESTKL